ncbi:MAG: hypothetical protein IPG42_05510 [Betaproteobacteria bacterium]|nr:hypothetical protein [Betaproteobacteria bacterium]
MVWAQCGDLEGQALAGLPELMACMAAVDLVLQALESWLITRGAAIGRLAEWFSRGQRLFGAYQYAEARDLVVVLRVRHQRELGYPVR